MSIHDSAPSGFYRCQLFVCAYFDYCIYLKTQLSLWSSETKTHAFTKKFLFWNFVTLWLLRFTTRFMNAKEVFSFMSIHDSAPSGFNRCQLFVCAYFDKTQLSLWSCETKTHAFMKKKFLFWNFVTLWLLRFTTRFMNAKEVVYLLFPFAFKNKHRFETLFSFIMEGMCALWLFEFELSQNYRDDTAIISHGVSNFLLNAS